MFTKIKFAMDMISKNPLNFIVSIILSGVGLSLVGFTLLVYLAGNNGLESAERVLANGIANTGVLEVEEFYFDSGLNFRKQAYDSPIIHSIGAFSYKNINSDSFPDLYSIQHNNEINPSNQAGGHSLQMLLVDRELLELCNLDYEKYTPSNHLDYSDENVRYIYLGYTYHDIPLETKFQDSTITYQVAGILKKDTCFVSEDLLLGTDFTTLRSDVNMNNGIICVNSGVSLYSPWIFSVDEKYTMEEGVDELNKIAKVNGIKMKEYTMQSSFDRAKLETHIMQEILLEMLMLILVATTIIVTTLQIVQIFHQAHSYGIMYSMGFSSTEIRTIMIIRNIIYFAFSLCLGIGVLIYIGYKYFILDIQSKKMFFQLLFKQVLPTSIMLMLLLFCVITIIPCIVFSRHDPIKLMQGE